MDHKVSPSIDFRSLEAKVDTQLEGVHRYLPTYRRYLFPVITSGNFITAQYNPYQTISGVDLGYHQYDDLFMIYDSLEMNVSSIPLTRIEFANGDPQQQAFFLKHTQALRPNLKLGLYYNRFASKGILDNQAAELTNYGGTLHGFDLKRKYHWFAGLIFNNINIRENGGIKDLMENGAKDTYVLNPFISNSKSQRKSTNIRFSHYYDLGGSPYSVMLNDSDYYCMKIPNTRIFQEFNYDRQYYAYEDMYEVLNSDGIYSINYYNAGASNDSFWLNSLEHRTGIQHWIEEPYVTIDTIIDTFRIDTTWKGVERKKELFWWSTSLGEGYYNYGSYFVNDLWADFYNVDIQLKTRYCLSYNQYLEGQLKYYVLGANNTNYDADINYKLVQPSYVFRLKAFTKSNNPSLLMNQFYGNHFRWQNQFSNIQDKGIQIDFKHKPSKVEINIEHRRIDNYIYFDTNAIPAQFFDIVSYTRLGVSKHFKFGFMNLVEVFNFNLQHTGAYYLRLPLWESYTALYAEGKIFKRRMWVQLGIEQRWVDRYQGYAYMPESGQFYLQDQYDVQVMPKYDAFFNWKVQRARLFITLENIWKWPSVIGPVSFEGMQRDYLFSVAHHPLFDQQFQLRFGIKWKFYY